MAPDTWLCALAGYGLPDAESLPENRGTIASLMPAVAAHRLVGVLAAAALDGGLELGDDDRDLVAAAHEVAMREALVLEEVLLEAVAVLDAAGVEHRVLKGAALAHTVFDDPAERSFGDNDILVTSAEIDRAVTALIDAGASRAIPALSPTFDRRFAKSVTLGWSGSTELDLHRTLAAGPYGHLIDLDELSRDPDEIRLAGRAVQTLPLDLHLLHGAIHVALGDVEPRLGNIRDIAFLARQCPTPVEELVATATRWGCAAPVAIGMRSTRLLGLEPSAIERWAQHYAIAPSDHRRLSVYRDQTGRFRRQALASLRVLGWRDRAAFTRALLVPSAANRAARGRTRRAQLRRLRSG